MEKLEVWGGGGDISVGAPPAPPIPGLTWIFTATSVPSCSTPRYTCPMEAAAKGVSLKANVFSHQPGPSSSASTCCRMQDGGGTWLTPPDPASPAHTHTHTHTPKPQGPTLPQKSLTVVCQHSMKSVLCRTRLKIHCSCELKKLVSGGGMGWGVLETWDPPHPTPTPAP